MNQPTTRLQMQCAAAHEEAAMTDETKPDDKPKRQRRTTAAKAGTRPSVAQALQDARIELCGAGIGKDKQAPATVGGYFFRGIDDIYNVVGPLLAKYGITVTPRVQNMDRFTYPNRQGNQTLHYIVRVAYEFTTGLEGDEPIIAEVYGEASDTMDKGVNKAMTSAYKNAIFQVFAPPLSATPLDMDTQAPSNPADSESDEVPQAEYQQPEQPPVAAQEAPPEQPVQHISEADANSIRTAVQAAGIAEQAFFQWIKVPVGQYGQIKTTQLQVINDTLKEKIRERSKQQAQELAEQTQPPADEVDFEDDIPF